MTEPGYGDFYSARHYDLNNLPEGMTFDDGAVVFDGSEPGALDATQSELFRQFRYLEREGVNSHPVIEASRAAIDWTSRWDDLASVVSNGIIATDILAKLEQTPISDTLDSLALLHMPQFPDERVRLTHFWRNAYLHSAGAFHMQRFAESIDPTSWDDELQIGLGATQANILAHPVATLNCLNAARLYSHPYPINGVILANRNRNVFAQDTTEFQHDALRILGSRHIAERPFATWYLLSVSAVQRNGTELTWPLLRTMESDDTETVELLNQLDRLVSQMVAPKWDGWGNRLLYLDGEDVYGRIAGALEYGDTAFYDNPRRHHDYDDEDYSEEEEEYRVPPFNNTNETIAQIKSLVQQLSSSIE